MVLRQSETLRSTEVLPYSTVRSLRNLQRLNIPDLAKRVYGSDNASARRLAQEFRQAYIEPAYQDIQERLATLML